MTQTRKHFTVEQKMTILRRRLLDQGRLTSYYDFCYHGRRLGRGWRLESFRL